VNPFVVVEDVVFLKMLGGSGGTGRVDISCGDKQGNTR